MDVDKTTYIGRVIAVSTSTSKGVKKKNIDEGMLVENHGLKGDAHAGNWHRQVSLLAMESVARMRQKGLNVSPGDFAENITVKGIPLWELSVGWRISLRDGVLLEITQIGKKCHNRCDIYRQVGDCVMPKEGIFAKVLTGGTVRPGDPVRLDTAAAE